MSIKTFFAILLQMALLFAGFGRTPAQSPKDDQLSAQSESEARALAADFTVRFEESGDVQTLMGEMFTKDFVVRLRSLRDGALGSPISSTAPHVLKQASDEELLRYYVATTNFSYLLYRHLGHAQYVNEHSGAGTKGEIRLPLRNILGAEVVELLKTDPALGEVIIRQDAEDQWAEAGSDAEPETSAAEVKNQDDATCAKNQDSAPSFQESAASEADSTVIAATTPDAGVGATNEPAPRAKQHFTINSYDELKRHLKVLEAVNSLLRRSAKSVLSLTALLTNEQPDALIDEMSRPRKMVLDSAWLNYPAGTKLVCVPLLLFHMDLVRVNGRLEIAALYPVGGCSQTGW